LRNLLVPLDTLTPDGFLKMIRNVGVFSRDGRRAVHKPLLLLLALARIQNEGIGKFQFSSVESKLRELIRTFGTTSNSNTPNAHYPFWYLRSDGFWEVVWNGELLTRGGTKKEPTVVALRENSVLGGFTDEVYELLQANPTLVVEVAQEIVSNAFPATLHMDILLAVGLDGDFSFPATKRDSRFRDYVLQAYSYSCAVCGFDGRLGAASVGVEAAHIRWVQFGGPNRVSNGIALCALHHKIFDMGGLSIDRDNWTLVVSKSLNGLSSTVQNLHHLHGSRIRLPSDTEDLPLRAHLTWHMQQVFRVPGMAAPRVGG
jgi:putative restriction endonuclease